MSEPLTVARDERGVATVTMDRPEVRNAFDPALIEALAGLAAELGADDGVRAVVLTGAGGVFSAGADLEWMRGQAEATVADNEAGARRMEAMFRALWELPKPLIGAVDGYALGGGAGLVAVCDVVVATGRAVIGFTEAALGIVPAVISPYVLRATSPGFARAAFVTAARLSAERAARAGLVTEVVDADRLDAAVEGVVRQVLRAGPGAVAEAKALDRLAGVPLDEAVEVTAPLIARLRASPEGQEGMAAFLERRAPAWVPDGLG